MTFQSINQMLAAHPDQVKRQEDTQSQLLPKQPVWAHGVVLELIMNLKGVIQDHL